jgi:protein transport protein HofQ
MNHPSDKASLSDLSALFIRTLACVVLMLAGFSPLAAAAGKAAPALKQQKETPVPISLEFFDAPVGLILRALAEHQQLNLVVGQGVEGNLTLRLIALPWQQAFEVVMRMGRLSSQRQGNVLMVFPESELVRQREQKIEQAARQKLARPLISNTLALKHADAAAVATQLGAQKGTLLSLRAVVSADTRTNQLFIRDSQPELDNARVWVNALDYPLQQVQLAAHIVTMNQDNLRELGIKWGLNRREVSGSGTSIGDASLGGLVENPTFSAGFTLARIGERLLSLELSALEQQDRVQIIASPRLMTANLQTASIKQGSEIPYQVSSGTSGATTIEFKEAVLGMEVTPRILPNGAITLSLQISQNMPGRKIKQLEGEALSIDKQEIKTQVVVKDGETLVLGGIFQQQDIKSANKVPGLGSLPLIGGLFKQQSTHDQRRELVIFITPTLINSQ